MSDDVYGEERARQLVRLLRALAERIQYLEDDNDLLGAGPELLELMGDARRELFRYEVRVTFDTPEVARSRRVVEQARRQTEELEFGGGDLVFEEDSEENNSWQ